MFAILPNAVMLSEYRAALTRAAELAQVNEALADCADVEPNGWTLIAWPVESGRTEPIFWLQLFHPWDGYPMLAGVWSAARRDAKGYPLKLLRRHRYGSGPCFVGGNGELWLARIEVATVLVETLRALRLPRRCGWEITEFWNGSKYPNSPVVGESAMIPFKTFRRVFEDAARLHPDVIYRETVFR